MPNIPFYGNLADNRHCLQACIRSALEAIFPDKVFDFDGLDRLTGQVQGKMTWPMRAYKELGGIANEVVIYDSMDFEAFVKDPIGYMDQNFGAEISAFYQENSDIEEAVDSALEMLSLDSLKIEKNTPNLETLRELLDRGFLCICHVDQNQLVGEDGLGDHSVLVFRMDEGTVFCHNPGPPPEANQGIPAKEFERVWEYPTIEAKTIIALK